MRHRVAGVKLSRTTAHRRALFRNLVTALLEHEIPLWGLDLSEVHLTRTDGNAGRREAGQVHHRGRLSEEEVVVRHGVRVVPAEEHQIDLAVRLDAGEVRLDQDGPPRRL